MSRQKWSPKDARQHADRMGHEYRRTKAYRVTETCPETHDTDEGDVLVRHECHEPRGHRGWHMSANGWSWDDEGNVVRFPVNAE